MSRFGNLEFNERSDEQAGQSAAVKDEAYYLGLAEQGFAESDFESALRYFSKTLEFNPANAQAWTGQVRMLVELGEFREAKLWADKALERFPRHAELLASKAVALGRLGDLGGALAFSDASIEERGDTPYIWLARGDVLLACREKRAGYCFEKASMLAPASWLCQWLASRIHHFHEQFSLALKFAQQALQFDATRCSVWLQLGCCQAALGLTVAAHNSFEQARQLNPGCAAVHTALHELAPLGLWAHLRHWWRQRFSA
jgi:tetratricopeptide (TPR) repeat protein